MQPRPVIYVSRITNLSDARYCAGMGVDLLGFIIDPTDPDYVSPEGFQEIIGWVSGPRRVVEFGNADIEKIESILKNYKPEYLHILESRLPEISQLKIPLLVQVSFRRFEAITKAKDFSRKDVAYWLVTDLPADQASIPLGHSVISFGNSTTSAISLVKDHGVAGIALQGSRESTPGLKDYDHLSRILEEFES